MKDDQQSYYEIQLNTHHLLLAFLGALVVGVAVFYFGVVVGRGQGSDQPGEEWQAALPAGEPSEEQGEEPLDFYESVQQPAEQVPAGEQGPGAAHPEEQQAEPAAPPAVQPATEPPAEEAGLQRRPANPVTRDTAALPDSDPSLTSGWIVQVRATTDRESADVLQAALARDGYPAFVVSADVEGQTWHRVRVGRYRDRADAEIVASRLDRRADVESTWVTEG